MRNTDAYGPVCDAAPGQRGHSAWDRDGCDGQVTPDGRGSAATTLCDAHHAAVAARDAHPGDDR